MRTNKKDLEILEYMLSRKGFVMYHDIAKKFQISDRMARNYVDRIEEKLLEHGHSCLQRQYGKGIRISAPLDMTNIEKLNDFENVKQHGYSSRERHDIILNTILLSVKPVLQKELAIELGISEATVSRHIKDIEAELEESNLEIYNKKSSGITILGDEIKKEQLLVANYQRKLDYGKLIKFVRKTSEYIPLEIDFLLNRLSDKGNYILCCIEKFEMENDIRFNVKNVVRIFLELFVLVVRLQNGIEKSGYELPVLSCYPFHDGKYGSMIRGISTRYHVNIGQTDQEYLMACIYSAYPDNMNFMNDYIQTTVYEMVERMVKAYEEISGMQFDPTDESLSEDLFHYIQNLIVLETLQLPGNVESEEMRIPISKNCLLNTKMVIGEIEKFIERRMNEEELYEIAACFQAEEIKILHENEEETILLVCGSGIGISKLIAAKLKKQFHINSILTTSVQEIIDIPKYKYNYIFSTIPLMDVEEQDYVLISSSYTQEDQRKIATVLGKPSDSKDRYDRLVQMSERLLDCLDQYRNDLDREHMKIAILNELVGAYEQSSQTSSENGEKNIWDVISKSMIQTKYHAENLYDAIRAGVSLIEDSGAVDKGYAEIIINVIEEYGFYMAVMPGVFFAHAENREHTHSVAVSIVTLDQELYIGRENCDPIKIIVTLTAVDGQAHMRAIAQLFEFLRNDANVNKIMNSNSESYIYKLITELKRKE